MKKAVHPVLMTRYDFRVLPAASEWVLEVAGEQVKVGYHGSFWAEEVFGDVVRLEMEADEIPSRLGLDRFVRSIDYGWQWVGDSGVYVAEKAELRVTSAEDSGQRFGAPAYQTRSEWSHCRLFVCACPDGLSELSTCIALADKSR